MKSMIKKSLVCIVFIMFGCITAHADVACDEVVKKYCDNMTKQECCESFGGYWCAQDQKCYDDVYGLTFSGSPCMTQSRCVEQGGLWCEGKHKCWYYEDNYFNFCNTIDETSCNNGNRWWCTADNTCYTDEGSFYYDCPLVDETYCKTKLGDTNHWCSKNKKCYYYTASYKRVCK